MLSQNSKADKQYVRTTVSLDTVHATWSVLIKSKIRVTVPHAGLLHVRLCSERKPKALEEASGITTQKHKRRSSQGFADRVTKKRSGVHKLALFNYGLRYAVDTVVGNRDKSWLYRVLGIIAKRKVRYK